MKNLSLVDKDEKKKKQFANIAPNSTLLIEQPQRFET